MKLNKKKMRTFLKLPATFALLIIGIFACTNAVESKLHYVKKTPPTEGAAAKIFGKTITEKELYKSTQVFRKQLEVYEMKKRVIDEMVRKMAFEALAKKKNMSVPDYMKEQLALADKKISEKEVTEFLKSRVPDPSKIPEKMRKQVKNILYLQNLVASYTKKRPVELYLQRPRAEKIDFNFANSPSWGSEKAPVTIVEFSDFQCPFCEKANNQIVKKIKEHYGKNKVRVVFKHFPLRSIHPLAQTASEASMCVNEQSSTKFWKFQDMAFDNQSKLGMEDLKSYAKKVGADVKKFDECMESKKYKKVVDENFSEGEKIGVSSTPTFFINSQPVLGASSFEQFKTIIDEEIQLAKQK